MAVEVRVTAVLQKLTGGEKVVRADGGTVGEVLADLEGRYPGLKSQLTDESGQLNRYVNIYLNDEDIRYLRSLATPTRDGDVVSILPALAGG